MKRGTYGSGSIEQRGPNRFRLTHYVGGRRQRQWVNGARSDANRRLRELTARADAGEHVPSSGPRSRPGQPNGWRSLPVARPQACAGKVG